VAALILHSDDFGLNREVNRAILEVAQKGVLASASLMTNGLAAEDALEQARDCTGLGVGLHLNIVRGRPLSNPEDVPSLVDDDGRFLNSVARLMTSSMRGKLSAFEVETEYRRQIEFMLKRNFVPTHLDGEKHTHILIPESARAVRKLAGEFNIGRIRLINEKALLKDLQREGIAVKGSLLQRAKLELLEWRSRQVADIWGGLRHPDATFGVLLSGNTRYPDAIELLKAFVTLDSTRTIEWMFHLGYPFDENEARFNNEFGHFFLGKARQEEVEFLLRDEVAEIVGNHNNQFGSYLLL
jgi:predicted glycoside hydrolase/deacetylase ChbG (UPF0249 family)